MRICVFIALLAFASNHSAKMTPEQVAALPPAATHAVDFTKEVKPILESSCTKCHGKGKDKGGFVLDTRESFLKGGDSGPAAVPGKSHESYLIELVAAVDPDNVMPIKGSKLTPEQVGVLRAWIDQGLKWDENVTFAKAPPVNLYPRKPEVPRTNTRMHPVDAFLAPYYSSHKIPALKQLVDDRTFLRRAYLDVIGVLPTAEEADQFVADKRPEKRTHLVHYLLNDNRRYAEHWISFWNDLLRNDYKGTGYIDGGRKQITQWLFGALSTNMPYNKFVGQLVNPPTADSEGFAKGISWRGVVNASQTPEMQAAQNISQVFMGVNLKCASCHDSFINDWSLADAYGFASVYAEEALEMVLCDKPTGKKAPTKFIYAELGAIDGAASKAERLKQLEEVMTSDKNGRLTRTMVNRLWARFMGRGLVEPLDDMEQPAWNQDLLDWLASDFAENGYNLRHTIEQILTSEAYQLPAVGESGQPEKEFVFRGPLVRRMTAEQYIDALATVTGLGQNWPNAQVNLKMTDAISEASIEAAIPAKWIWSSHDADKKAAPSTNYFRKVVTLPKIPGEAQVLVSADNRYTLYVNGRDVSSGNDHNKLNFVDVIAHVKEGPNVFAIRAINDPAAADKPEQDQSNPAGLIAYVRLRSEQERKGIIIEEVWDFATDSSWIVMDEKHKDWEKFAFQPVNARPASELGSVGLEPWNIAGKLDESLRNATLYGEIRSALVNNNPLMVALGRPNREQVVSVRSSVATTLQALELTNGETLAKQFQRAAERLLQGNSPETAKLVQEIYTRALQRKASPREIALAQETFGPEVKKENVEDMLWAVSMLPEFQLIY